MHMQCKMQNLHKRYGPALLRRANNRVHQLSLRPHHCRTKHIPFISNSTPYRSGWESTTSAEVTDADEDAVWSLLDMCGWVGSVAGTAAFMLTQELWLMALPIFMPLLALYASQQSRRRFQEVNAMVDQDDVTAQQQKQLQQQLMQLQSVLGQQLAAQRSDLAPLKSLEGRLSAMEGSMLSAGRSTRAAAAELLAACTQASQDNERQWQELRKILVRDLRGELALVASSAQAGGSVAVADRLENRLEALERALDMLEATQSDSLRRLTQDLTTAIQDVEQGLESVLRQELFSATEPMRRLPQLVATIQRQQGGLGRPLVAGMPAESALPQLVLNEERIAGLVGEEVRVAVAEAVDARLEAVKALERGPVAGAGALQVPETALTGEQWRALGKRLTGIEQALQELSTSQASVAGALSTASLSRQLAELKGDLTVAMQQGAPAGALQGALERVELQQLLQSSLAPVAQVSERLQQSLLELQSSVQATTAATVQLQELQTAAKLIQQAVDKLSAERASASEIGPSEEVLQLGQQLSLMQDSMQQIHDKLQDGRSSQLQTEETAAATSLASTVQQLSEHIQELSAKLQSLSANSSGVGSAATAGAGARAVVLEQQNQSSTAADSGVAADTSAPRDSKDAAYSRMQALLAAKAVPQQSSGSSGGALFDSDAVTSQLSGSKGSFTATPPPPQPAAGSNHIVDEIAFAAALNDAGELTQWIDSPDQQVSSADGRLDSSAVQAATKGRSRKDVDGQPSGRDRMLELQGDGVSGWPAGADQSLQTESAQCIFSGLDASTAAQQGQQRVAPNMAPASAEYAAAGEGVGSAVQQATAWQQQQQQLQQQGRGQVAGSQSVAGAGYQSRSMRLDDPWLNGQAQQQQWPVSQDSGASDQAPAAAGVNRLGQEAGVTRDPQQQLIQEQQQQVPGGPGLPQALEPQQAVEPQPTFLPVEAEVGVMLEEGLQLLRRGRDEARNSQGDLGLADRLLAAAASQFAQCAEQQPDSVKALGNWGNALLAHGEVKKRLLAEVEAAAAVLPLGYEDDPRAEAAIAAAEQELRAEAEALLLTAGKRFRAVLELQGEDCRALANWGKALCLRASIATEAAIAAKLLSAAVQKFELALDIQQDFLPAVQGAAMALRDFAYCQPPGSRESCQALEDAVGYLLELATADPSNTAVAQLLQECQEELELQLQQQVVGSLPASLPGFPAGPMDASMGGPVNGAAIPQDGYLFDRSPGGVSGYEQGSVQYQQGPGAPGSRPPDVGISSAPSGRVASLPQQY